MQNQQPTEYEMTLYDYLEKLDVHRKQRNAKVERILKLLCDLEWVYSSAGLEAILKAKEIAHEILKDDRLSKYNKPPVD